MPAENKYIPALNFRWLTPLYDPLLKWGMREESFKRRLIERANIQPKMNVLDLGCGTGTLTVMLKQSAPMANVTGLDGDPQVLSIAQSKAEEANVNIKWDQGLANKLPYPDSSFDLVVSSLMIHHLTRADKLRAFREVHRILRPAGWFRIVDFGKPFSLLTRIQTRVMFHLEEAADNFTGRIQPMLQEAGFSSAREAEKINSVFGPIWFYEAQKSKGRASS